jgi:hypothetical protein
VARYRWLWVLSLLCLVLGGCNNKHPAKKPDPTKGAVTGIVLCADTGKPARFATVTLSAVPQKDEKAEKGAPLPATETTMTDLEGRFRLEAVEPGRYYAFATLEGYLDPVRGLDIGRIDALEGDREQELEAIREWKEHLVDLSVHVHRTSDVTLQIERGAEINGTVSFDDGSPAIGMHFQVLRKTEKGGWSDVGFALLAEWAVSAASDGHGRFSLTNLTAGEYTVCAMMPGGTQDSAACVCLGNVLRKKDAATVKVKAGEVLNSVEIAIPLSGLHTVAGNVTALADGHAIARGKVLLLYADDREKARESALTEDGSFSFEYVPEGKFIVQVAGAADAEEMPPGEGVRQYKNKEIPVTVLDNVDDLAISLSESVKPAATSSSTNPAP